MKWRTSPNSRVLIYWFVLIVLFSFGLPKREKRETWKVQTCQGFSCFVQEEKHSNSFLSCSWIFIHGSSGAELKPFSLGSGWLRLAQGRLLPPRPSLLFRCLRAKVDLTPRPIPYELCDLDNCLTCLSICFLICEMRYNTYLSGYPWGLNKITYVKSIIHCLMLGTTSSSYYFPYLRTWNYFINSSLPRALAFYIFILFYFLLSFLDKLLLKKIWPCLS